MNIKCHFRFFEVHPVYPFARENPKFPSVENPEPSSTPEIKVKIEFHNDMFYASNMFTVSVEMAECYRESFGVRTNFNTDNVVNINTKNLELSNKSSEKCLKEYTYHYQHFLMFNLQCKLTFNFIGDFAESFDDAIKVLKNVASKSTGDLLKDPKFYDFTIFAGNESFKVHKCILANASSVFGEMFTCGLDKTKLNSTTFNCMPKSIGYFLKFIYEGTLPSNEELKSLDVCIDMYELADRFEIQFLKKICKQYALQLTVNKKNALKIYEFASTYKIQSLLNASWEIVKT